MRFRLCPRLKTPQAHVAFFAILAVSVSSIVARAQGAPPQPISAAQLNLLLEEEQTGDAEAPVMHAQLEKKRTTLPAWFPSKVWDDVEHQVEAIHFAEVALPVYHKYMTGDQADAYILLLKGPTGQEIATILAGRSNVAAQAGLGGSANDREVGNTLKGDSGMQALFSKRLGELTPEQRANLQALIPGIRAIMPKIEDESNAAYNRKANEIVQKVIAEHKAEIAKAQAAASSRH